MGLWTHLLPLLALLALWAPTPAPAAAESEYMRLCRESLVDVVTIICGDRGFRNPTVPRELPNPQVGAVEGGTGGPQRLSLEELLQKSDIVEECCANFCSFYEMERYCN